MVALLFKQWIRRKKARNQVATEQYIRRLQEAADKDKEERLSKLREISNKSTIEVRLENLDKIDGFKVVRDKLSEVHENDPLIISRSDTHKKVAKGKIIQINDTDYKVQLHKPISNHEGCKDFKIIKCHLNNKGALDKEFRVKYALRKLKLFSCSLAIHKTVLGSFQDSENIKFSKARTVILKELANPKGVQRSAVEQSMRKRISLIEGVAGSGKTLIAAHIACSMTRSRKRKILLCSPMQTTVDKLADMINNIVGVSIVKLPSESGTSRLTDSSLLFHEQSSEDLLTSTKPSGCSLIELVDDAIFTRSINRLTRSHIGMRRQKMRLAAEKMVRNSSNWLRKRIERKIILKADVVCCTLDQAGSSYIEGVNFDMLIIDDAQMASEIDCLMPLTARGLKQVTLLSDMRRDIKFANSTQSASKKSFTSSNLKHFSHSLSGTVKKPRLSQKTRQRRRSRIAEAPRVEESLEPGGLFERLISIGLAPVALKRQYRMLRKLTNFPGQHFYLSRYTTDKETNSDLEIQALPTSTDSFDWLPDKLSPSALFDVSSSEFKGDISVKEKTEEIVSLLITKENIRPAKICVITNLKNSDFSHQIQGVRVGTVEDFFGQEYDYIVVAAFNCIEQETKQTLSGLDINFLVSDNALHIVTTRARLGLFIAADLETTRKETNELSFEDEIQPSLCKSWLSLVEHYTLNKLVS